MIRKFLQGCAVFVAIGIIYVLSEGNYKMMNVLVSETNFYALLLKSITFGIASLVIIAYYRNYYIKAGFVLLDMALIFCFQYFPAERWADIGAFIYAPYIGLMLFAIGKILTDLIDEHDNKEKEANELKEAKTEMFKFKEMLRVSEKKQKESDELLNKLSLEIKVSKERLTKEAQSKLVTNESVNVLNEKIKAYESNAENIEKKCELLSDQINVSNESLRVKSSLLLKAEQKLSENKELLEEKTNEIELFKLQKHLTNLKRGKSDPSKISSIENRILTLQN